MISKLIYLPTHRIKAIDKDIIDLLSNYPKFKSVSIMAFVDLPISRSIIITNASSEIKNNLERELKKWKVSEYLVRSDKKDGAVNAPSFQNCSLDKVWQNIEKVLNFGLLPMVMAEGDIFHNTYSINILIKPHEKDRFYLEIVGPGFCATDLNKRDIVNEQGYITENGQVRNSQIVSQKVYDKQIDLLKESVIKKEIEKGRVFRTKIEEYVWVDKYLKKIGALILNNTTYIPINEKYLRTLWGFIPKIINACELMGYKNNNSIVSMSFVLENGEGKPYFWDIHPYDGYRK